LARMLFERSVPVPLALTGYGPAREGN
jgi:hypothetical protein